MTPKKYFFLLILHFRKFQCLILFCLVLYNHKAAAQHKAIEGSIINSFTKEKISFASVYWKKAGYGTVSDSVGNFRLTLNDFLQDTLVVSYVGFEDCLIPIDINTYTLPLTIYFEQSKSIEGVVIKTKISKGLLWWKKIIAHKSINNPYKFDNYFCALYNKMEVDLENLNKAKFSSNKLLRPFGFILDNIDSVSEAKPFLPVFITESLSDYYYSKKSSKVREEIKATQTNGIKNETLLQFIGGASIKINVYENYMQLFGKEFISPLSTNGDNYYNYKGADTQFIAGERYLHLIFKPKREGENTFSGDCWIHNKTWAIQKITLNISPTANINYVNRLSIIQEFAQQNDSTWIFAKDKFITEVSFLSKDKLAFIVRKTSLYKKVQINQPFIEMALNQNSEKEKIIISDSAALYDAMYWQNSRPEALTKTELQVFKMIDTLKSIPLFKTYTNALTFIVDGRKKLGAIEIGPWYKWISGNQLEKIRLRFDIATTEKFSKHLRLHIYAAYGFKDKALKGQIDATYKFPGKARYSVYASYTHDLDNGRLRNNNEDVTTDNIFSQLIRRPGIPQKFLLLDEAKLIVKKEWKNNITTEAVFTNTNYETFKPLPKKNIFSKNGKDIINTEGSIKIRYAPGEKAIKTRRKEYKIRSNQPVFEVGYTTSIPSVLGSVYQYQKITAKISQNFKIPLWGKVNYQIYGGKYFGEALPFMLLELHPGNEIYYYNKNTFNLMNRFEYIGDRYVGFNVEHDFEKKLLNLLPFMRKTSIRQFWNVKAVWSDLSKEDRILNLKEFANYQLRSLKGDPYIEIGTGLDNIFKILRIDCVWRFAPPQKMQPHTKHQPTNFGIFGSLHFQF